MIMTRDRHRNSSIEFWTGDDINDVSTWSDRMWSEGECMLITSLTKKDFKKLFCGEPLPRKGSKQYISHLKLIKG